MIIFDAHVDAENEDDLIPTLLEEGLDPSRLIIVGARNKNEFAKNRGIQVIDMKIMYNNNVKNVCDGIMETANTFSPNNFEVMSALATGYLKTNRTKEAVNLLDKAKKIKPNDIENRKKLLEAYSKLGQRKQALSEMKGLLQVNRDPGLLMLYAKLLYEEGDVKDAENAIEDIRATDPENIKALMLLALIQRSRKKYNEAIETYKEVIFIDANYAPALFERAETYMQQNKPQWAERFYYRALRADPKYARAELGMANICRLRKDKAGHLKHLKAAKQIDPNDPKIKAECKKAKIY